MANDMDKFTECRVAEQRLYGDLMAFFDMTTELIRKHPPEIAVSYITDHIDRITPGVLDVRVLRNRLTDPEDR